MTWDLLVCIQLSIIFYIYYIFVYICFPFRTFSPARQALVDLCAKAGVDRKGNMLELKNRLVSNFLRSASCEELLSAEKIEIWDVGKKKGDASSKHDVQEAGDSKVAPKTKGDKGVTSKMTTEVAADSKKAEVPVLEQTEKSKAAEIPPKSSEKSSNAAQTLLACAEDMKKVKEAGSNAKVIILFWFEYNMLF